MALAVVCGLVVPGSEVRWTTGSSCEKDVRPGLDRAASKSSDCVSALAAEIACVARHCFCSLSAVIWASFMRTCRRPDVPAVIHLQTCRCTLVTVLRILHARIVRIGAAGGQRTHQWVQMEIEHMQMVEMVVVVV